MKLLSSIIFFLSLYQVISSQQCGTGTEINTVCVCPSGFTGANCENDERGTSCTFPTPAPLESTDAGELNTRPITQNTVSIDVVVPGVTGRIVTAVIFGSSASSPVDACAYPSSTQPFSKSFDNHTCSDVFTSSIPVSTLYDTCGFTHNDQNVDRDEFLGSVWLKYEEALGTFRSTSLSRTITSKLGLIVSLPAFITVNGTIDVFSAAETVFILTNQEYDPVSDTGSITITSIASYPYKLGVAEPITSGVYDLDQSSPTDVDCDQSTGDCIQTTIFNFTSVSQNGCTFTGSYEFEWDIGCRSADCPSSLTAPTAGVTLESSNVCSSVSVYSSISGSISTNSDDTFQTPQTSFLVGNNVFVQALFDSDVEVDHYVISNLYVIALQQTNYLVQNGQVTSIGTASGYIDMGDNNFKFAITVGDTGNEVISTGETDIALTFAIYAEYEIFYKTTFKREIVSEVMTMSQEVHLTSAVTADDIEVLPKNSSASLVSSLPLLFIALIASLFLF